MIIRQMTSSAIDTIVKLEEENLGTTLGDTYFNRMIDDNSAYFLVALIDDKIVGYISSTIDTYSEILNFFVIEEARRKGLGYELLKKVIEKAIESKSKSIYLEVNEHNEGAIALYLKCGFKIDHIRKNYYKDANAYAMIKEL